MLTARNGRLHRPAGEADALHRRRAGRGSAPGRAASPLFAVSAVPGQRARRGTSTRLFLARGDPRREARVRRRLPLRHPARRRRPALLLPATRTGGTSSPADPRCAAASPSWSASLLLLLAVVGVAAALGVYLPLRLLAGRGLAASGHAGRFAAYFARHRARLHGRGDRAPAEVRPLPRPSQLRAVRGAGRAPARHRRRRPAPAAIVARAGRAALRELRCWRRSCWREYLLAFPLLPGLAGPALRRAGRPASSRSSPRWACCLGRLLAHRASTA